MSDQKVFSIKIDGVEQGLNDMQKLEDIIRSSSKEFSQLEVETKALKDAERERTSILTQLAKIQSSNAGSIKEMGAQLSVMRKQYDNLSKAERENENIGGKLLKNIQALDKEYKEAKESTGRFQDSVGNYGKALEGVNLENNDFGKQLTELKNKMQTLISAGIDPTSEAYKNLENEYLKVVEQQKQFDEQMKDMSSRSSALDNIAGLGVTMASSFGAASSALALFGDESDEITDSLKKSAAAMQLVNQLQTIQNNLLNTSSIEGKAYNKILGFLSSGEKKYQAQKIKTNLEVKEGVAMAKADTVAKKAEAAADEQLAAAEQTATVAAKGLKAALAATGVGLLVVAVGTLVAKLSELPSILSSANRNAKALKATIDGIEVGNLDITTNNDITEQNLDNSRKVFERYTAQIEAFYDRQKAAAGKNKTAVLAVEAEKNKALELANTAFYEGLTMGSKQLMEGFDKDVRNAINNINEARTTLEELRKAETTARKNYDDSISKFEKSYGTAYSGLSNKAKEFIESINGLQPAINRAFSTKEQEDVLKAINAIDVALGVDKLPKKAETFLNTVKEFLTGIDNAEKEYVRAANTRKEFMDETTAAEVEDANKQDDINAQWRDLNDSRIANEREFNEKLRALENERLSLWVENRKNLQQLLKSNLDDSNKYLKSVQNVESDDRGGDIEFFAEINAEINRGLDERLRMFEEYCQDERDIFVANNQMELDSLKNRLETEKVALKENYDNGIISRAEYDERLTQLTEAFGKNEAKIIEKQGNDKLIMDKKFEKERESVIQDYLDFYIKKVNENFSAIKESEAAALDDIAALGDRKSNALGMFDYKEEETRLGHLSSAMSAYWLQLQQNQAITKGWYEILINEAKAAQSQFEEGTTEYEKYEVTINGLYTELNNSMSNYEAELRRVEEEQEEVQKSTTNLFSDWVNSWSGLVNEGINLVADAISSVYDYIDARQSAQIAEMQRQLETINQEYDAVTAKYEESVNKIEELQDKLAEGDATRSLQLGQQIDDEIKNRNRLAAEERRLAKEKEALERRMAKLEYEQKRAQLVSSRFSAIANTATAVTLNLGSYPWPYSLIPVGVVTGMGVLQQATISQQINALKSEYAGKFAEGGEIKGRSHAEGGVKLEAEGGEYIVNKRSTASNFAVVDYINHANRPVTIAELTAVMGGRKSDFQAQYKNRYATGGGVPEVGTDDRISQILKKLDRFEMHPVVSVVDINTAQQNLTRVQELAGA